MQLPNKLYSYKNSTLYYVPIFLKEIEKTPISVFNLYEKMKGILNEPTDFLSILDCLYALRKIEINDQEEIYYVV